MKLREKIADWISGGALSRARQDARDGWSEVYRYELSENYAEAQAREQSHRAYILQARLNRIAACETSKANATVRRMARIARGEAE